MNYAELNNSFKIVEIFFCSRKFLYLTNGNSFVLFKKSFSFFFINKLPRLSAIFNWNSLYSANINNSHNKFALWWEQEICPIPKWFHSQGDSREKRKNNKAKCEWNMCLCENEMRKWNSGITSHHTQNISQIAAAYGEWKLIRHTILYLMCV